MANDTTYTLIIEDGGSAVIKKVATGMKELGATGQAAGTQISEGMQKAMSWSEKMIADQAKLIGSVAGFGPAWASSINQASIAMQGINSQLTRMQAIAANAAKIAAGTPVVMPGATNMPGFGMTGVAPSVAAANEQLARMQSIAAGASASISELQSTMVKLGATNLPGFGLTGTAQSASAANEQLIRMQAIATNAARSVANVKAQFATLGQTKMPGFGVTGQAQSFAASNEQLVRMQKIAGDVSDTFGVVSNNIEKGMNKAKGGISSAEAEASRFHRTMERLQRTAVAFIGMWVLTKVFTGFSDLVKTGLDFNAQIEQAGLGISSILISQGKFTNSVGETLAGYNALIAAQQMSDDLIKQLQVDNLSTIATFDQLVKAFQQTLAPGLEKGFNVDQVRQFTVAMVQAAGAMGLNLDMLAEETRSLLRGTINPRQTLIATALGLRNEDVAKYQGDAKGLFDFLMGKLEAFKIAGIESQKTWMGLMSNVKDALKVSLGAGFEDLFKFAKQEASDLLNYLIVIDRTTGTMKVNPEVVEAFRRVGEFTQTVYLTLKDIIGLVGSLGPPISLFAEAWRSIAISAKAWKDALTGTRGIEKPEEWVKAFGTPMAKEPEFFGKYRGKGMVESATMGLKDFNDWVSGKTRQDQLEKINKEEITRKAGWVPPMTYTPNIKEQGGEEESKRALVEMRMKVAEMNKDYDTQISLINETARLKTEELTKQDKLNDYAKEQISAEREHNTTLVIRKESLDEIARKQDLSGFRSQLAGLTEDYKAESREILNQSDLLIKNKLISKEWNQVTDEGIIKAARQTATWKASQAVIDGIYKDTKRMADAQAQYGALVGDISPQFVLERLELEKELSDLARKNKLTADYAKLRRDIQGIKEEKVRFEDYSKAATALNQMGIQYGELFGDAEAYLDSAERQRDLELKGMGLELELLTRGGSIEKANMLIKQMSMKYDIDSYNIEMKALELKNKIPDMLDQQLSKQADLLGDYDTQVILIDRQLTKEKERVDLMETFGVISNTVANEYRASLDATAEQYKKMIALEKELYGPDILNQAKASYAEATGNLEEQNVAMKALLESDIKKMMADVKIDDGLKKQIESYMRQNAVLQEQLRMLEKRNQLAQFRGELAGLTGDWSGMKQAEIDQLEIERQKLIAINGENSEAIRLINQIYDLRVKVTEAEKNFDQRGLIKAGMNDYAIRTAQQLVNLYKDMIPNAIDVTVSAFGDLIDGTKTWNETLEALSKSFAQLLKDIVLTIAKMEILNALGYGSKGATTGVGDLFGGLFKSIFGGAPGPTGNMTQNVELAEGGLITRPTRALIGERGTEFVQPASAVSYYGPKVMEALKEKEIPKEAIQVLMGGNIPVAGSYLDKTAKANFEGAAQGKPITENRFKEGASFRESKATMNGKEMGAENKTITSTTISVPINIDTKNKKLESELRASIETTVRKVIERYL